MMRESMRNLSFVAYTLVLAGVAAFIASIYGQGDPISKHHTLQFALSVVLAATTFGLFIKYWIATDNELEMLTDYLNEASAPRVKSKTRAVIIFLAIFFGLLIAISDKILIYCMFLVVYNLLDLWGNWQVLRTIKPLIQEVLATDSGQKREVVLTIYHYYFENPTVQRIVTIMFINWIALIFALMATYEEKTLSQIYQFIAYAIVILNIAVGEMVMARWRRKRDAVIERIEKKNPPGPPLPDPSGSGF